MISIVCVYNNKEILISIQTNNCISNCDFNFLKAIGLLAEGDFSGASASITYVASPKSDCVNCYTSLALIKQYASKMMEYEDYAESFLDKLETMVRDYYALEECDTSHIPDVKFGRRTTCVYFSKYLSLIFYLSEYLQI